jgi:hypothetical protein
VVLTPACGLAGASDPAAALTRIAEAAADLA